MEAHEVRKCKISSTSVPFSCGVIHLVRTHFQDFRKRRNYDVIMTIYWHTQSAGAPTPFGVYFYILQTCVAIQTHRFVKDDSKVAKLLK